MTIKHLIKLATVLLMILTLATLMACGGGGGTTPPPAPQAKMLTVTFSLDGSADTAVGAVDLDVTLPEGFTLETVDGEPTSTALAFLVNDATTSANYTVETVSANGGIIAGVIKADGFPGNSSLMRISRTYAAGATLPTVDDFMVTLKAYSVDDAILIDTIAERLSITTQNVP